MSLKLSRIRQIIISKSKASSWNTVLTKTASIKNTSKNNALSFEINNLNNLDSKAVVISLVNSQLN